MISLFLGAGFSKWAFDLPLVSQLFDFNISYLTASEEKKLHRIKEDWSVWIQKNPGATYENFVYWCINKSSHRRSRVVWYVNRRLTEPFITRILGGYSAAMFDEKIVKQNERIVFLRNLFNWLEKAGLKNIITCNYDNIVEYILGCSGFNYGIKNEILVGRGRNPQFPWQNADVRVTGEILLAKLHGSLSWDKYNKYTSGKPGRTGKALIVPPAPEKEPPLELLDVWSFARNALANSKALIVFGFSFNAYDNALLNLLRESGSNLKKVILIDPYPKVDEAKCLWPSASIETINPSNDIVFPEKWFEIL